MNGGEIKPVERGDPELFAFAADGLELGAGFESRSVLNEGVRIHYYRSGPPDGRAVVLSHGGLGHAGNMAHQAHALAGQGFVTIAIDTRGHGRSSWDGAPFHYSTMGRDLISVLDHAGIERAALVGWSDGACTSLEAARMAPERVTGVLFFACNVDESGTRPFEMTPVIERSFERHKADHARLSEKPEAFDAFFEALGVMQGSEPGYTRADLEAIEVPVTVLHASGDEFILKEHARYIAEALPNGRFRSLDGVTHFAPIQNPAAFNAEMLAFLVGLPR